MIKYLQPIRAWRSRRELRELQQWEQIRKKGKGRFLIRTSIYYGFAIVGITDLYENLFYGVHYVSLPNVIYYLGAGFVISLIAWSDREAKFKRAVQAARRW